MTETRPTDPLTEWRRLKKPIRDAIRAYLKHGSFDAAAAEVGLNRQTVSTYYHTHRQLLLHLLPEDSRN